MFRTLEMVLGGLVAAVLGLSVLARRFPEVAWLQVFRRAFPQPSAEQRARMRRRANVQAGVEMILMGLSLPLLYLATTVMFFNDFTTTGIVLVAAASTLLTGLGFTAIWRSRRS